MSNFLPPPSASHVQYIIYNIKYTPHLCTFFTTADLYCFWPKIVVLHATQMDGICLCWYPPYHCHHHCCDFPPHHHPPSP